MERWRVWSLRMKPMQLPYDFYHSMHHRGAIHHVKLWWPRMAHMPTAMMHGGLVSQDSLLYISFPRTSHTLYHSCQILDATLLGS